MTESQSKLKINSNKLPKWCKALILSLPVIVSFFQIRTIDNDFYFLYARFPALYIFENEIGVRRFFDKLVITLHVKILSQLITKNDISL